MASDEKGVHDVPVDDPHDIARASSLNPQLDKSAPKSPHAIGLVDNRSFAGEKAHPERIMPRLAIAFDPELEAEPFKDMCESPTKFSRLVVIPGEQVSVIDIGKEERAARLRLGRRPTVEHEEKPCTVGWHSEKSESENHAVHEYAVNDVQSPVPSHRNSAEACKNGRGRLDFDVLHLVIEGLRDAELPGCEDTLKSEPGAEAQPSELVEGVHPVERDEAATKGTIGMTPLSSFEMRAAKADRREGKGRGEGSTRGSLEVEVGQSTVKY